MPCRRLLLRNGMQLQKDKNHKLIRSNIRRILTNVHIIYMGRLTVVSTSSSRNTQFQEQHTKMGGFEEMTTIRSISSTIPPEPPQCHDSNPPRGPLNWQGRHRLCTVSDYYVRYSSAPSHIVWTIDTYYRIDNLLLNK
jgi:hypothetical protein